MLGLKSVKLVLGTASSAMNSGLSPLLFARSMKTHKGAAKRWWMTGSGTFQRKQAGRRHGNVGWSRARILRHLNGSVPASNTQRHKKLHVLMPFAKKK